MQGEWDLPVNYSNLHWKERREVRKQYVSEQFGNCAHCKELLSGKPSTEVMMKKLNLGLFPEGFLENPIHLHHCHKTGMTIGAVHAYCNGVLWQYHGE